MPKKISLVQFSSEMLQKKICPDKEGALKDAFISSLPDLDLQSNSLQFK